MTSGFSSMRRLADRLLAYLRRRFDRPTLLPHDYEVQLTVWIAPLPDHPGKFHAIVHRDPANVSARAAAKYLTIAAAIELARDGQIEPGLVAAAQAPPPPPLATPTIQGGYSIARPHPYQRVKGKR